MAAKELLVSGVVSHALGENPFRVKYSRGSSKLAKVASSQASEPASVSTFNNHYSDTGLFGFHIVADKDDIGKVVRGVFGEFQKSAKNGLTNDEIARAKYVIFNPILRLECLTLSVFFCLKEFVKDKSSVLSRVEREFNQCYRAESR